MTQQVVAFIHELSFDQAPIETQDAARRSLLDLIGVAASGTTTELSRIVANHVVDNFGSAGKGSRILFDGRRCSVPGAALAGGMLIDSVDAHDGLKMAKGHVGCGVLPSALAFADINPETSEHEFMTQFLLGYEIGSRAGIALHATACDYHTSGAWICLASAAIGARALQLDSVKTREALGVAEYHGPRSQMMRTIDHPTMVKDGSGWGAMAGCSAALLAQQGFTGAPAVTMESDDAASYWSDLGSRWFMEEQYIKAFPVCRWAQPAIAAVLQLKDLNKFSHRDIKRMTVGTFHESKRLVCSEPSTTEEAQYSLPFPVAVAAVHGDVGVQHIQGEGLKDTEVLAVSNAIEMIEVDEYNNVFPGSRISHVVIELNNGQTLESGPVEAAGDPEKPFDHAFIEEKFMRFAAPVISEFGAVAIKDTVNQLGAKPTMSSLGALLYRRS